MSIELISPQPLEENSALFKNSEIDNQDKGNVNWGDPFLDGEVWKVTIQGQNVEGETIEETTIEIDQSETISPQKVFLWIADKLKSSLCPSCV